MANGQTRAQGANDADVPRERASTSVLETFTSAIAGRSDNVMAFALCTVAAAATIFLLPIASRHIAPIPGFLAFTQTSLALIYGLTTWLFLAQYANSRSTPLLVLGAGSLFTTLMILVQLTCFPNFIAQGLVFGQGPATLTWLWCIWHAGPPLFVLGYVIADRSTAGTAHPHVIARNIAFSSLAVVLASAGVVVLTTRYVHILPSLVGPNEDYAPINTTGVGSALSALTVVTLAVLGWSTRLRTVLQVWLAASLFLLALDNIITDAGAARATVGWYFGRAEAFVAAFVILFVYIREINTLYASAANAAAARDVALRAASASRDNLEIALDASGMGDWEIDLGTKRSRRTIRHDRIFGYQDLQDDWNLDRFLDHVVAEDRQSMRDAFDAAQDGMPLNAECRIIRNGDDATRWIGVWGKTYFDAAGRAATMAGCIVDTTDRRLDEQRLREAERMEAIGQLTGGVAHDFNNLLTVIMGSLDMIKRRPDEVERVERLAQNAFLAGQRGTELTEKLLSFSRRQVVNPKTVNLNKLLTDFRPLLERAVGETIRVEVDLDTSLDPARVDIGQFQAAILNLAGNARDAMPSGGILSLRTRNVTLPEVSADGVVQSGAGDYVQVTISDTGVGMDKATAAKAFDPFFTTKDVGRGTGLGLSQVYGFAHQAGGQCQVQTAPGQGCAIEIYLPRSTDDVAIQPDKSGILPIRRAAGQEVVLVVEDEDAVRDMAAESLESMGYGVLTARDARFALDLLRTPNRIDILFSDVVMPGGMNGAQLAMEARALRPDLKVLLTSGYTTTATGGARELPRGVPLLKKPYLREELAHTLEAVLKVVGS